MAKKYTQPVVYPLPGTGNYILKYDFFIRIPFMRARLKIKAGFIFDGASIPRTFWITTGTPFRPVYMMPGLVHDYLYASAKLTKPQADKVFLSLLLGQGVGKYTAYKMYLAVKFFGVWAWRRCRRVK